MQNFDEQVPPKVPPLTLEEILFRGLIWMFAGIIFAFLFLILREYVRDLLPPALRELVATCGAGVLTTMIYGSMRLTVIIGNVAFIVMLAYVGTSPLGTSLEPLIFIGASLGICLGALYGWQDKQSHICRADSKIIASLVATIPTSLILIIPTFFIGDLNYPVATFLMTPLVILIYVSIARWFVVRCCNLLPPAGDGALVGLVIGLMTGFLFMLMAASLNESMQGQAQMVFDRIYQDLLPALGGGAAGAFIMGAIRAMLHVRWYDL
jgi:hypothetical protein